MGQTSLLSVPGPVADEAGHRRTHWFQLPKGPTLGGCESSLTPGVVFVTAALLTLAQIPRPRGAPE